MSDTTTTILQTLTSTIQKGDPDTMSNVLGKLDLGNVLTKQVDAITQTSATTFSFLNVSGAQAAQTALAFAKTPRSAMMVQSVRVTAGTVTPGNYLVVDSGATPATATNATTGIGICTLSADGSTLTFSAAVTGLVVVWYPMPAVLPTAQFTNT